MGGLQVQNMGSQPGSDGDLKPIFKKQTSTTLQHSIRNPGSIGIPPLSHSVGEHPEGNMITS
jgi:hypothetical protein